MGLKKVACWSIKAAISLKRAKIEAKSLWMAYRKSPTLSRTVPFPTPYAPPFPRLEVRNPRLKLQSLLSQERVKLRNSNLASTFTGPSEQMPIKNFGVKGAWAYPGTAHSFWVPPIISGMGQATNFKFCTHVRRLNPNKIPLEISGEVAMGVVRDPKNFQGNHI